jgi:cytochrome c-type biogenesis protein CcmE
MRTRQIRLVVSLVVASLLATVLVYTALASKVKVLQVHDVLARPAVADKTVRLNGRVLSQSGDAGSSGGLRFVLRDNEQHPGRITVVYHGSVPDAFQRGRSVIVDGKLAGGTFVAVRDSLSTKCPSKYSGSQSSGPSGV